MSSITSYLSNAYSPLDNQPSSSSTTGADGTKLNAPTTSTNSSANAATTSSYLLNLSQEAQSYLSNLSNPDRFTLSKDQQETLDAIIASYKDAPYTQETFDTIKKDIEANGISLKVLKAQDEARNFNPTIFLLDALNGTTNSAAANSDELLNKKVENFLGDVLKRWQSISTTMEEA